MAKLSLSNLVALVKGDSRVPVVVGLVCLSLLLAWPNFVQRQKGLPDVNVDSFEGAVLAADYASRQNNLIAEAFYFTKAHRLNPTDMRILDRLFSVKLVLGDLEAARKLAGKLVAMNPHHAKARLVLAAAAVKGNEPGEAAQQAAMVLADDSARVAAGMLALWAGQMAGDDSITIPALVELENESLLTGPALRNIALFHEFTGDTARAEEVYESVIKAHGLLSVDHALDFLFFLHRSNMDEQRNFFFKNIGGHHDGHAVYRHIRPLLDEAPEALSITEPEALARAFMILPRLNARGKNLRDKLSYIRIANWMAPSRRGVMAMADILAELSLFEEAIL